MGRGGRGGGGGFHGGGGHFGGVMVGLSVLAEDSVEAAAGLVPGAPV